MKIKQVAIISVLLIFIAGAGLFIFSRRGTATEVTGYLVTTTDYSTTISGIGYVQYNEELLITTDVTSEVLQLPYEIGDVFNIGDVLVTFDNQDALDNLESLNDQLSLAEARLKDYKITYSTNATSTSSQRKVQSVELASYDTQMSQLQRQLEQTTTLYEAGIASKSEVEAIEDQISQLESSILISEATYDSINNPSYTENEYVVAIDNARKAIERQENSLGDYSIQAEIQGIVLETNVNQGQYVSTGTSLMTVASIDDRSVYLDLDEAYLGEVYIGQEVYLYAESYDYDILKGSISKISPIVDIDTGTFELRIDVDQVPDYFLKNLAVRVDIVTEEIKDILIIPKSYLINGESAVYVLYNDTLIQERSIQYEELDYELILVKDGLTDGSLIIQPGELEVGDQVILTETEGSE